MKNKILFVLLLSLVFVLGILSVRAWDKYKIEEQARMFSAEVQRAADDERAKQAEIERSNAESAEKARLQAECEAGITAYETLSPSQQSKIDKPVCSLEQVE